MLLRQPGHSLVQTRGRVVPIPDTVSGRRVPEIANIRYSCYLIEICHLFSETLYRMDRNQLQKLIQHLITEYHTLVLPATQRLADDIMQPKSEINTAKGGRF